jgi:hypothetical protein
MDSFITELGRDYKVYHIVTSYHKVQYFTLYYEYLKKIRFDIKIGWNIR